MTRSHHFPRARRGTTLTATAAWLALFSLQSSAAPKCAFNSVAGVSFGAYDVFAPAANSNGVGSLSIQCQGGGAPSFVVSLSTGQSNSYTSRVMKSGANQLAYNLYTTAARTVVWGDGTGRGGSGTVSVPRNTSTILSVFGKIPAAQDAAVGTYTDGIVATVTF